MKPKYLTTTNTTGDLVIIQENPDGTIWSFMADPANTQYQAYLKRDEPEVEHLTEILPTE